MKFTSYVAGTISFTAAMLGFAPHLAVAQLSGGPVNTTAVLVADSYATFTSPNVQWVNNGIGCNWSVGSSYSGNADQTVQQMNQNSPDRYYVYTFGAANSPLSPSVSWSENIQVTITGIVDSDGSYSSTNTIESQLTVYGEEGGTQNGIAAYANSTITLLGCTISDGVSGGDITNALQYTKLL